MKPFNRSCNLMLFTCALLVSALLVAGTARAEQKAPTQKSDDKAVRHERAELLNIPLVWKPTVTISSLGAIDLSAFQNAKIIVKPFTDLRLKPAEIGRNVEKRFTDKGLAVTTKDNVAAWLTDRFASILLEFDVPVVKEGGGMSIEADVLKFFVTEESTYKADVGLKIRLRSKTGDVVWEGMIAVSNKRWGASYKADNYYELLSNSCIDVVQGLLKNDAFIQAVQKNK